MNDVGSLKHVLSKRGITLSAERLDTLAVALPYLARMKAIVAEHRDATWPVLLLPSKR